MDIVEKLEEKLPKELRLKWRGARHDDSDLHRAMKLIVALHLLNIGHHNIEFEYYVKGDDGFYYVDVCDLDGKAFIECIRESEPSALKSKYMALKKVKPDFKVIAAVRDVMSWEADKYANACDDVWVLRIDGTVLNYRDWPNWRIQYLLEPLNPAKIEFLSKIYRYAFCLNKTYASDRARQIREFKEAFRFVLRELGVSSKLMVSLMDKRLRVDRDPLIEGSYDLIREVKREIVASLVELFNRLMEISKPYKIGLMEDGSIKLEFDCDVDTWLGNEFNTDNEEKIRERGWRNLKIEVNLLKEYFPIIDPLEETQALSEELKKVTEEVENKKIVLLNNILLTTLLTMI